MNPLISICIPAYKRTEFLQRLLDSIDIQTFKNFEVIVTDDSPGNDV
jgi:glycosyltransferase involved in cell wall biosynthesis